MKLRVILGGNQDLRDRLDAAPADPLEADRNLLRGLETRLVPRREPYMGLHDSNSFPRPGARKKAR